MSKESDPFFELATAKSVMVDQKSNLLEGCCKCFGVCCADVTNVYDLILPQGTRYQAKEQSTRCGRCWCNPNHELNLAVKPFDGTKHGPDEILNIFKPFKCCCPAIIPCWRKEITITRPGPGGAKAKPADATPVGFVQQPCCGGWFTPTLNMYNKRGGEHVGDITGPCCCFGGMCSSEFNVKTPNGVDMAKITRKGVVGNGVARSLMTDADRYNVEFTHPTGDKELPVDTKLMVVSSVLMLDYMFFEGETNCLCNVCACPPYCAFKCCDFYCCGPTLPCRVRLFVPEEVMKKAAAQAAGPAGNLV